MSVSSPLPTSILGRVNSSVSITVNLTPSVLLYPTCCSSYCIKAISTPRWWSCHAQKKEPYDSNHTTNILEGEIEKRKEAEEPRTGGKREGPELAGRARDDETCGMGRAPFPLMRRFSEKKTHPVLQRVGLYTALWVPELTSLSHLLHKSWNFD